MKRFLRNALKYQLRILANLTTWKHKTRIIAVVGGRRAELLKEYIYQVLADTDPVRRNTKRILWDFAVPLNILGIEDKQRSILGWIGVLLTSVGQLIFLKSHKHAVVLSFESGKGGITDYWADCFRPEIIVWASRGKYKGFISNYLGLFKENMPRIILHSDDSASIKGLVGKDAITYGFKTGDFKYSFRKNDLLIAYKNKKYDLKLKFVSKPLVELLIPGIIVRILLFKKVSGLHLGEFQLNSELTKRIIHTLNVVLNEK